MVWLKLVLYFVLFERGSPVSPLFAEITGVHHQAQMRKYVLVMFILL